MKNLLLVSLFLLSFSVSFSQRTNIKADKYPSLLWEIKDRNGKVSYLFGTMHVSSKMVFHLSDSFYLAIRKAQVVALETNPGTWQEDFSRYDLEGESYRRMLNRYTVGGGRSYASSPEDYLTINTLRLTPFEKKMEAALYSSPSMINSFLYRSNSEAQSDFEEDTYLDLHIFQTGRKLGKRICGVEDFDGSMRLVKEAYADAAKEKRKQRRPDYDEDFSYGRMEEAYRTGNLDLLDTINKVNSQSAAFDEKFLYKRNEIQAASIDSILRSGASLFVGVGAAHLPGSRGVIELLRQKGYSLRPVRMTEHNSLQKETIEKIRVPVKFAKQSSEDGFYSVLVPGKLYSFGRNYGGIDIKQCADMTNGSYYMVTRIFTNAAIMSLSQQQVVQKLDSVLYENIPGKLLFKKPIVKNGYHGYDIVNRTRRGDVQRYNIFITPFELVLFKMSGNGDYVKGGTEAEQFFGSIQLKGPKPEWKTWSPPAGGFEVELPHQPGLFNDNNWVYAAYDSAGQTAFEIIRTDVHNYEFLEEDSFDLNLMEESFASSEAIARSLSRRNTKVGGYPALDMMYRYKDSSVALVRFLIQGPRYYTVVANAAAANQRMDRFIKSFAIKPFRYGEQKEQSDTVLRYSVVSPVALEKKEKLQMYPTDVYGMENDDPDDSLLDNGDYKSRLIDADSTGEKITVAFYRPSRYFSRSEIYDENDSTTFKKEWKIRREKHDTLLSGTVVAEYELGSRESSRMLKEKFFSKGKAGYTLMALLDTLSAPSSFVSSFFQHFSPLDTLEADGGRAKKTALFFSHLFSADTTLRKKAVKNISGLAVDSADFLKLKQGIETVTWRDKKYLTAKEDLIGRLAQIKTKASSDYLQALYYKASDTVELQYAILEALLGHRTAYAYKTFGELMQTDPPVLDMNTSDNVLLNMPRRYVRYETAKDDEKEAVSITQNGSFLDHLTDSLALTTGVFKKLLPLINADDYEEPMMNLMKVLVDSGYLRPADYESYLPKFMLEAKQALKKQLISEKSKAITQAQNEESTEQSILASRYENDFGNEKLGLYATLLLPFWDKNSQVPQLINRLLQSDNKRIKYTTALLLIHNHRPVPDTVWTYFAAQDNYRYELFGDLKKFGKLNLFPEVYKTQMLLAKSKLLRLQIYNNPDTVAYLAKMPLVYKDRKGNLYIFKYKEKTEDNTWKLATVGLFPEDSTLLEFDLSGLTKSEKEAFDFTELTDTKLSPNTPENEQLEKLKKKILYGRRKSGAQFYEVRNGDDMEYNDMR